MPIEKRRNDLVTASFELTLTRNSYDAAQKIQQALVGKFPKVLSPAVVSNFKRTTPDYTVSGYAVIPSAEIQLLKDALRKLETTDKAAGVKALKMSSEPYKMTFLDENEPYFSHFHY